MATELAVKLRADSVIALVSWRCGGDLFLISSHIRSLYMIYNAVPATVSRKYDKFHQGDRSAVQKVARCMPIPEGTPTLLGLGGHLPDLSVVDV